MVRGKETAAKGKMKEAKGKGMKKSAPSEGGVKEGGVKRRFKAGTVALREIKRYQKQNKLLLLKAPFYKLVREITREYDAEMRF